MQQICYQIHLNSHITCVISECNVNKARGEKEPRPLILDGNGNHITGVLHFECYDINIYLRFLPAYASHVLQPLVIAVFGLLKYAY
jgi:hypothetical protein